MVATAETAERGICYTHIKSSALVDPLGKACLLPSSLLDLSFWKKLGV